MVYYSAILTAAPLATPTMPPSSTLPDLDDGEVAHSIRAIAPSPTAPPAHVQAQSEDSESSTYARVDLESRLGDLVIPQSISSCTNTTLMTATASANCVIQSKLPV